MRTHISCQKMIYVAFSLARITSCGTIHFMDTVLTIIQLVLGVLLIASILIQRPGDGLDGAIGGGGGGVQGVKQKRRGFEKFMFEATISLSILFVVSLLIPLLQ